MPNGSNSAAKQTQQNDNSSQTGDFADTQQGPLPVRETDKPYLLRRESEEDRAWQIQDLASI